MRERGSDYSFLLKQLLHRQVQMGFLRPSALPQPLASLRALRMWTAAISRLRRNHLTITAKRHQVL